MNGDRLLCRRDIGVAGRHDVRVAPTKKPVPFFLVLILLSGCDWAERPRRPIPEHFAAESLTGEAIDRDTLKGRPWVITLWVPG